VDDLLAILIPEMKDVPGLEKWQEVYSWGGKDYPQEPIKYRCGLHVELRMSELQTYLWDFFPEDYRNQHWLVLDVAEETLNLFEYDVNGKEVDWGGSPLDKVLETLLSPQEKWAVVFEPHYDQMNSVYRLTVSECVQKLKANYSRSVQKEGFIALGVAE
jgi:hypothetical protein